MNIQQEKKFELQEQINANEGRKFYYDSTEFKIKNNKLYLHSELFFDWYYKPLQEFSEIETLEIIKQLREKNTYFDWER